MADKSATSQTKNILILGGSYGGISTAHYILQHVVPVLPNPDTYRVIVISASSQAICRQACPRALISDTMFPQDQLFVTIPEQFAQYPDTRFRFVQASVTRVDHTNQSVSFRSAQDKSMGDGVDESLDFHALVIATGASTPSPLLGFNRDERYLRASWEAFRQALPTAKTIVVGGGGPTAVEVAGELGEYLNGRPGWFKSTEEHDKVKIMIVTSATKILPLLRPAIAEKAERYLAQVGVSVIKNARVASVSPESAGTADVASKAAITLEEGKILEADLYIPAFGTTPNTSFLDQSLLTPDGRVNTDPATLRVTKAGKCIYAIGDASSWARPAVHSILDSIPILCANLRRDLMLAAGVVEAKAGEEKKFKEETRETQLVPIGKSKGVGAAMGWRLPSFLVWLIKGRDYWLWTTKDLWSGKHWNKK
jgi:apoptosis-inducing factor 2